MKSALSGSVFFLVSASTALAQPARAPRPETYYPPIEPFRTGYLKVSDRHELYFELCGKSDGEPVFMLHGGPGSGCGATMRQFHDPKKYLIILHDQRGAGKSKPYAETRENSTQDLVADIERLRIELKLERIQLFGGSWGSTLALAYAEKYPANVSSMVLRGIFTATREEIDHFYHGGTAAYFPEVYAKFKAVIPNPNEKNYPRQILDILRGDDAKKRKELARAWAAYETKIAAIGTTDAEVNSILDSWDPFAFSLIENHYMANRCFFEEGQLLRDAIRIAAIPTVIVHGRYDVICPPATAFRLHQALPASELVMVEDAGHSGSSPPMVTALIQAVKRLEAKQRR